MVVTKVHGRSDVDKQTLFLGASLYSLHHMTLVCYNVSIEINSPTCIHAINAGQQVLSQILSLQCRVVNSNQFYEPCQTCGPRPHHGDKSCYITTSVGRILLFILIHKIDEMTCVFTACYTLLEAIPLFQYVDHSVSNQPISQIWLKFIYNVHSQPYKWAKITALNMLCFVNEHHSI